MNDKQNKRGGGLFTFFVGIAAGAAAGYYMSTEEGRRMREKLGEQSSTLSHDAQGYARDTTKKVNENLQTALTQSKEYVNDLSSTVKSRVDELSVTAKARAEEVSAAAKTRATELSDTAKTRATEFSNTAKARFDEFSTTAKAKADQTSGSFQEGVARGKAKLDQQKAEIDNLVQGNTDKKDVSASN